MLPFITACSGSSSPQSAGSESTGDGATGLGSADTGQPTPGNDTTGSQDGDTGTSAANTDVADSSGTTSGEVDTSGSTGEAACAATHRCVGEIPEGWTGPVALQAVGLNEVPDCGGDYDDLQLDQALGGLTGDDFECGCECSVGNVACEGSARVRVAVPTAVQPGPPCVEFSGAGGVSGSLVTTTVTAGTPQTYGPGVLDYSGAEEHGVEVDMVDVGVGGACTATASETPTSAAWTERTIACGSSDVGGACGDAEVCIPRPLEPYDSDICIWADGDLECPEAYPDRTLRYGDYDDTRDCSACSCGGPDADCSDPSVRVSKEHPTGACETNVFFDAPNGGCEFFTPQFDFCASADHFSEIALLPGDLEIDLDAPCPAQGGNAVGNLTPTDPVTLCCTET